MTTFKQFLINEIKNSDNIGQDDDQVADKTPKSEFQANIEMRGVKGDIKSLGSKSLSPAERARAEARKKKKGFFDSITSKVFSKKT